MKDILTVKGQLTEAQNIELQKSIERKLERIPIMWGYLKTELTTLNLIDFEQTLNTALSGAFFKIEKSYENNFDDRLISYIKSESPFTTLNGFQSKPYYSVARKNALLFILDDTV